MFSVREPTSYTHRTGSLVISHFRNMSLAVGVNVDIHLVPERQMRFHLLRKLRPARCIDEPPVVPASFDFDTCHLLPQSLRRSVAHENQVSLRYEVGRIPALFAFAWGDARNHLVQGFP